ncbi:cyclic peptide export ABC transporter [Pseudorhodoplanes sp.]|uniref:cyclic peptide export ABC transporter n=1 Tax=Pseudorhodoplanes sp. TaxID=1934341 RepID=UPI002B67E54A|nr:cyclic peptide export ABC transporter [Pseudorhodoplanes sp.]HWV52536.1 cyclic peptide export ABC transporter [Pseudorhodoplanes sp.]
MSFLQLVHREMHASVRKLVFMSVLGGVSNAAILTAINTGAAAADTEARGSLWAATLFVVSLFLFFKTQVYVSTTITSEIEAIIHKLRVRMMDYVRRSELLSIEEVGRARIIAAISSDAAILTQASNMLSFSIQGPVLIGFVAIYVAYLSLTAFLLSVLIVSMAGLIFHFRSRKLVEERARAAEHERRLFDRITDFLDGFKEVRLNRARSDSLFDDAVNVSRTAANIKIRAQSETFKQIAYSQGYMYILLGTVVFVAPQFSDSLGGASIAKITAALLYVIGACFALVQSIPILMNANAAADRIQRLEDKLREAVSSETDEVITSKTFESIEMRQMVFSYVDRHSDVAFHIGPIDFTLRSGELLFITGGNGSGKSTFLRVLAGLYHPESGEILLNGKRVTKATRDEYRELFSAIFYDYHLFRRLYGIQDVDTRKLADLLAQFRLEDKTGLTNDEFRTLDLSGGQRRRLALIVSLMEDRPIMLLDEWTAEQDPEYRRKFYDELLPEMMRAGKTVVVITHDDRYLDEFRLPARRIHMEEGRIVEERTVGG